MATSESVLLVADFSLVTGCQLMQHYTNLNDIPTGDSWLTIGAFDGIHLGHQFLFSHLVQSAHQDGARAVILTFDPHPAVVLRGLSTPYLLTTHSEKLAIIANHGLDAVVTLPFSTELAALSADEFMQMICQALQLKVLCVAKGFALGKDRIGTQDYLAQLGKTLGYRMVDLPVLETDGVKISSSLIRRYLQEGDVARANSLLGRSYSVSGIVTHGEGRGRNLGFPTANVTPSEWRLLPARGVYACRAIYKHQSYLAVTNIGMRPTFTEGKVASRLETHLLDFNGDLYQQEVQVEFIKRIRDEKKFSSIQELIDQVQADISQTREEIV